MITSDQTEINLGEVKLGESRLFEFLVSNGYDKPMTVGVQFGCSSCTTGGFYPDNNFAPSDTKPLKLKFTPTGTGIQAKTVRLNYLPHGANTAEQIVLRFKATVTP